MRHFKPSVFAVHQLMFSVLLACAMSAVSVLPAHADSGLNSKEALGRKLFFDTNLSQPSGQSCATCHTPSVAFTDPDKRFPTSKGVNPDLFGNRNAPTAAYAAFSPPFHYDVTEGLYVGGQFWDGRASSLEEQAKGPFLNPVEMANPSKLVVVEKVRHSAYAGLFRKVFGRNIFQNTNAAYDKIADAIAAFERTATFSRFSSKYDAWLAGKGELSARELRGLALFEAPDKGNCAACHISRPDEATAKPLFTDFTYDNLGVPKNPRNRFYQMPAQFNPAGADFVDLGLGGVLNLPEEEGKQKVPTLRNIAKTSPYMHNGYFKTLRGVVDFYNSRDTKPICADPMTPEDKAIAQGCWPAAEVPATVNHSELGNLGLNSREIDDIVAFMQTLTDRPARHHD